MAYATEQEFIESFGLDLTIELTNLENPEADTVDSTVMTRGLTRASALIDGYLDGRYSLPLASTPELLKSLCLDIARYQLGHYGKEDDARMRYDDALKRLQQIANGTLNLGLPAADTPAIASGSPQWSAPARVFDSDSLKGF
jgi:phage gp36-like protein